MYLDYISLTDAIKLRVDKVHKTVLQFVPVSLVLPAKPTSYMSGTSNLVTRARDPSEEIRIDNINFLLLK